MSKIDLLNNEGNVIGEVELNEDIFDIEPNEPVVHEAVVQYLANQRQGTKSAKTRSEVRGGGRKPYRQKGTGRARAGSNTSPLWRGGGIVFAPKPRDFSKKMNKKAKNLAIRSVFSDKNQNSALKIIDDFKIERPRTKDMVKVLDNLDVDKALIIIPDNNKNIILSANSIPKVDTTSVGEVNVYDLLLYDTLVITKDALDAIQEVYKKR